MTESAFNRPVPVQEQQAALKADLTRIVPRADDLIVVPPLQDRGHLSTHPNFPNGLEIPGVGTVPVHSTAEYAIDDLDLAGLDTVSRGAILDGLRENPITEMLNAPNPLVKLARDFQAREEAAIHTHAREPTAAEATKALEAVMQERIKEALDNDIETRARYEGSVLGNPVVSDPSFPPGFVGAIRLTAEQLKAIEHLKPGETFRNAMVKDIADATAGRSENLAGTLEPEPPREGGGSR